MVYSMADVAELFGVTPRAVRGWIEKGWLKAYRMNPRLWAVSEWELAGFVVGRLDAYRAWVRGENLGSRAPQQTWTARRGAWSLSGTIHAQVTAAQAGVKPWKARTWYVLTWTVDNAGSGAERHATPEQQMVRTQSPAKARRWLAERFAAMGALDLLGRSWKAQAWWPNRPPWTP